MQALALLCLCLSGVQSYVLVPLYPPVSFYPRTSASAYPLHPYIQVTPPLLPVSAPAPDLQYSSLEAGLKFSPKRANAENETAAAEEEVLSASLGLGRIAGRNLDLCYFLGNDIFTSHVPCNPNWGDGTNEGVNRYINEFTFQTNKLLGENNMKLTWKGPYHRHDAATSATPSNPSQDVVAALGAGCDAVVFLVFNKFDSDCKTQTFGHEFGGVSSGGMCEQSQGKGYTVVVDQGFLGDAWTGPQILAHHLLLMLTSDLRDRSKTCPNKDSLLHPKLYPGQQRIDRCVVDKLNRSRVSDRPCMQNY